MEKLNLLRPLVRCLSTVYVVLKIGQTSAIHGNHGGGKGAASISKNLNVKGDGKSFEQYRCAVPHNVLILNASSETLGNQFLLLPESFWSHLARGFRASRN